MTTPFGSPLPFAEPPHCQGHHSPYYTPAHRAWRQKVRAFVEEHIAPHANAWDLAGDFPATLARKAYAAGILGAMWPRAHGGTPPDGSERAGEWHGSSAVTQCDPFFDMILFDELCRPCAGGTIASLFSFGIGLPPIIMFGGEAMRRRVARPVITGAKTMCLCVTEPFGGSDVASLRTEAVYDAATRTFVVSGQKKWITGGVKADFFTVVARTRFADKRKGDGQLSMLLLERGMPGITTRRMATQGWCASNTAFVEFDSVPVPEANLVGEPGKGFKYTMINFNHERFMMAVQANRYARSALEEAVAWARRRKTFGRRLADHQAVRHKVAECARRIEGTHALLEHYCYQVRCGARDATLYGFMAMLKVQATKTLEYVAREASQILGGSSYTRGSGAGAKTDRVYRLVRVMAIGGGSEEVMLDLAMRASKL